MMDGSNKDYRNYAGNDQGYAQTFTWQYMVVAVSAVFNILQSFNLTTDVATWVSAGNVVHGKTKCSLGLNSHTTLSAFTGDAHVSVVSCDLTVHLHSAR